jgi:hypothetical protein
LSRSGDDVPEPANTLIGTFDVVVELKDAEWKDLAKEIADELRWQLGGINPDRNGAIGEEVEQFLKKVRSLNQNDLEKQRPELERSARELVANTPPTIVLHHFAQHTLAELLSNPRLGAALDALLEKDKKDKEKSKDAPPVEESKPKDPSPKKGPEPKKDTEPKKDSANDPPADLEKTAALALNLVRPLVKDSSRKAVAIDKLEQLIKRYPNTKAAKEAKAMLDVLKE